MLIRPCDGCEIKQYKEHAFASSSKCTKGICKMSGGASKHILKHEECLGFVPLSLKSSGIICNKCSKFIKNKKIKTLSK